jgi:hypothetical protein
MPLALLRPDLAKLRNQLDQVPPVFRMGDVSGRACSRNARIGCLATEVGNRTGQGRGIRVSPSLIPARRRKRRNPSLTDDIFKVDGIEIDNAAQFYRRLDTSSGAVVVEGASGGNGWTRRVELKRVKPVASLKEPVGRLILRERPVFVLTLIPLVRRRRMRSLVLAIAAAVAIGFLAPTLAHAQKYRQTLSAGR